MAMRRQLNQVDDRYDAPDQAGPTAPRQPDLYANRTPGEPSEPSGNLPLPPSDSASTESPRERPAGGGAGGGAISATPRKPMSPTPMAGSVSTMMTPQPFSPLPDSSAGAMLRSPMGARLYGRAGGLQGGGLGVPLDPSPNEQNPISDLIKMLMGKSGGV